MMSVLMERGLRRAFFTKIAVKMVDQFVVEHIVVVADGITLDVHGLCIQVDVHDLVRPHVERPLHIGVILFRVLVPVLDQSAASADHFPHRRVAVGAPRIHVRVAGSVHGGFFGGAQGRNDLVADVCRAVGNPVFTTQRVVGGAKKPFYCGVGVGGCHYIAQPLRLAAPPFIGVEHTEQHRAYAESVVMFAILAGYAIVLQVGIVEFEVRKIVRQVAVLVVFVVAQYGHRRDIARQVAERIEVHGNVLG